MESGNGAEAVASSLIVGLILGFISECIKSINECILISSERSPLYVYVKNVCSVSAGVRVITRNQMVDQVGQTTAYTSCQLVPTPFERRGQSRSVTQVYIKGIIELRQKSESAKW